MPRRDPLAERRSLLRLSCLITGVSVAGTWAAAAYTGLDFAPHLKLSIEACGIGLALTVPMLLLFLGLRRVPWEPLREVYEVVELALGPALSECRAYELILIALGAGLSEELLFRGLLPGWLVNYGTVAVLVLPNVLFGLVHAVTAAYVVLAFTVGLYLSCSLWLLPNCNLLSVMIAHAIYDLVCFHLVTRSYRARISSGDLHEISSPPGIYPD